MKSNASLLYGLFLLLGDFLALVLAFVGAYILRVSLGFGLSTDTISVQVPSKTYLGIFLTLLPFWILIFAMLGLYNSSIHEKRFIEAGRLLMGSFIGMLFVLGYAYVSVDPVFPGKLIPFYGFALAFLFLVIFRNLARWIRSLLFRYDIGLTNTLIIGDTKLAQELVADLSHRSSGYRIVGIVSERRYANIPTYKNFEEAIDKIRGKELHSIVQTELFSQNERNNDILDYAQQHHVAFRFIPGNTELFVGNIQVELFRQSLPVIAVHQTALIGWGRIVKRLFDLIIGSFLILITSPIMFIVAVLVKLDGGPIFFRQVRLTRFNNEFRVFKFRTIRQKYNGLSPEDAFHKMERPDLLKKFRENGNFLANDPRNTRVGKFIRSTSLDELPQLFNVVKGDLSLVGPRALVPEDLEAYKKHMILSVKSGITGLAQVSGRNNLPVDERRRLDIYYVQNWSFWLDLVILLKTFRYIFTHETEDKSTIK